MKNTIFAAVAAAAFAFPAMAQDFDEEAVDEDFTIEESADKRKDIAPWPAFFAVGELPSSTPDLVGLRITIPYSTKHESVTGFDVGLWGRAMYFEGLQANILRNDVKDELSGVQVGLYNSAAQANMIGVQAGLWNECGALRGAQGGLVNTVGSMQGVQIGLINRAEELYGFQVGIINVIRDAELKFCPVLNVGF